MASNLRFTNRNVRKAYDCMLDSRIFCFAFARLLSLRSLRGHIECVERTANSPHRLLTDVCVTLSSANVAMP